MPVWKTNPIYLQQSIESILEQTYQNIELLIIYQKSNQKIDYKIEEIFKTFDDPRLKIIETKINGFTNSLNFGITEAKGDYIARMDSDDISEKTRFQKQIEYMRNNELDLIGTWAYSISEDGKIIGKIQTPKTNLEIRKKILFHNPFLHPSILFSKFLVSKIGSYDSKFEGAEDYDFYLRALSKKYKVANIPEYLIKLRETKDSIMRGKGWQKKRLVYWNVKKNAVFNLEYKTPRDLIYFLSTIFTLFVTPKMALSMKKKIGYNID